MPTKFWRMLTGEPAPEYPPNWLLCPNGYNPPCQGNNFFIPTPMFSDFFLQNQSYFMMPPAVQTQTTTTTTPQQKNEVIVLVESKNKD